MSNKIVYVSVFATLSMFPTSFATVVQTNLILYCLSMIRRYMILLLIMIFNIACIYYLQLARAEIAHFGAQ